MASEHINNEITEAQAVALATKEELTTPHR